MQFIDQVGLPGMALIVLNIGIVLGFCLSGMFGGNGIEKEGERTEG